MNRKNSLSQKKFLLSLIIVSIIFIGFLIVIYFLSYNFYSSVSNNDSNPQPEANNYTRGQVIVMFNPDVSETEALELIEKYNLSPFYPDTFYKFKTGLFHSSKDNVDDISREIALLPFVRSANATNKADGVAKRSFISVDFNPAVSALEIQQVLGISETLSFDNDDVETFGRHELIKVPIDEEMKWIDVLRKESIVRNSSLNSFSSIN